MKKTVTNWDEYHRRVRISQRLLWTVWRAYADLMKDISFDRPIKIVELGCGTGYHTMQMTRIFPVSKVTLVDFNESVIEDTERRFAEVECDKEFVLSDLFKLQLEEKFDIVHSQGLLEHYNAEGRIKLMKLHRDLLTPEGLAVILVPTPSFPYRFWRGLLEKLHLWIYHDETAIPFDLFAKELDESGFEVLKMQGCHLMEVGAVCRKKPGAADQG